MKKAGTAIPPGSRKTPSPASSRSRTATSRFPPPRNDSERAARARALTAGLAEDCHLAARLLQRQQRPDLAAKILGRASVSFAENLVHEEEMRNHSAEHSPSSLAAFLTGCLRLPHDCKPGAREDGGNVADLLAVFLALGFAEWPALGF